MGTRAGRVARIIRLIRLIRIVKLYKNANVALAKEDNLGEIQIDTTKNRRKSLKNVDKD